MHGSPEGHGLFTPVPFTGDFKHIINGTKVGSDDHRDVINPADEQVLASVPVANPNQVDQAIDAATNAFPSWAATPVAHRQATVQRLGQLLRQFAQEFKVLLTKEQGKPITESGWETLASAAWFYEIAKQSLPDETVFDCDERTATLRYKPLGVVAVIVPWNLPVYLMTWKIAPALLTGNTVIVKPSPFTPLCAMKFVELAQQVLPPGVLSVLNGDDELGPLLTSHPKIAKVSFTGSTATGKLVMQSSAKSIKRLTMELGGNDPALVFPDVDPQTLVPNLFNCMFQNAGQICIASKRIYVHEDIYDAVRDGLVAFVRTVKAGNGLDPENLIGPIQNQMQYNKVKEFIVDCKSTGLKFACGGQLDEQSPGYFVPVTIIDNPPEDSRIVLEEPFGPIAPLLKWKDEEDLIRRANNSEYGLAARIFTNDMERADRISQRLEVGTVWINDFIYCYPEVPFSGHKTSGLGTENGKLGLQAFTNTHVTYRKRVTKHL